MIGWKVAAIIFMCLFFLSTIYIIGSVYYVLKEGKKIDECYYGICGEYEDAYYEENICYCYDKDILGNLVLFKTEVMN
jgi:hypothetical protein